MNQPISLLKTKYQGLMQRCQEELLKELLENETGLEVGARVLQESDFAVQLQSKGELETERGFCLS